MIAVTTATLRMFIERREFIERAALRGRMLQIAALRIEDQGALPPSAWRIERWKCSSAGS